MTMATGKKYLILAAVLTSLNQCCVSQQKCDANLSLSNIVAYEGSPASFSRVDNGKAVQWQVYPISAYLDPSAPQPPYIIADYNSGVVSEFQGVYEVNSTELIIFDATSAPQGASMSYSTAGLYLLSYDNGACTTAAFLIVIRSGPECQCNASDSENVQLSCSVDFASNFFQPQYSFAAVMTWTNSSGFVSEDTLAPSTEPGDNPGLQSFVSTLTITADDAASYVCQLAFLYENPNVPADSFVAANSPNFTASCSITNCLLTTTSVTTETTTSTAATTTSASTTTVATSSSTKTSSVPTKPETTTTTRLLSVPSDASTSSSTSSSSKTPFVSTPGTVPSTQLTSTIVPPIQSFQPSTATNPSSSVTVVPTTATQSGVEAEVKATSIILGVVLAAVISVTVVFAGWFYCFYLKPSANPGSISKPRFIYSDRRFRNYRIY